MTRFLLVLVALGAFLAALGGCATLMEAIGAIPAPQGSGPGGLPVNTGEWASYALTAGLSILSSLFVGHKVGHARGHKQALPIVPDGYMKIEDLEISK